MTGLNLLDRVLLDLASATVSIDLPRLRGFAENNLSLERKDLRYLHSQAVRKASNESVKLMLL
jgi:hypothetical protein